MIAEKKLRMFTQKWGAFRAHWRNKIKLGFMFHIIKTAKEDPKTSHLDYNFTIQ